MNKISVIVVIIAFMIFIGINVRAEEEAPVTEEAPPVEQPVLEDQKKVKVELSCTKELLVQALSSSINELKKHERAKTVVLNQTTANPDTLWKLLEMARAREKFRGQLEWLLNKCKTESETE